MYEKAFIDRLAHLRMVKGVSARDMSLSLGQNPNYINSIETGKAMPSMSAFFYICEYLGVSPGEFFDTESKNPEKLSNLVELLKKLSDDDLDSITKVDIPRAKHGPNTLGSRCMLLRFRRSIVFFPVRKRRIHTAPTVWLRTVASAAPFTPMPRAKIKIGSRIMLITAPIIVVIILILANP